jgi:hypothetical protein
MLSVFGQAPTITSFAPTSASAGQTVLITGTNFESILSVTFGGVQASSFTVMSGTQIAAVVGTGSSGSVGVTKTGFTQVTKTGFTWTGSVMGIVTDFQGFWKTSSTNVNTNYPDDAHNLLAFTYGNVTYSTGLNNTVLNSNNITYTAGNFRALPALFSGTTGGSGGSGQVLFCLGKKMDGNVAAAIPTSPLIKDLTFPDVLSDGSQGLNIGSGYANLSASATMSFRVKSVQLNKISDSEPDLVVTQVADPSTGSDTYRFVDASGNVVGTSVVQNLTLLPALSNYALDIFTVPANSPVGTAKMNGIFQANTTRPLRLLAFKLSDFGINASNVSLIHSFQILPSGTSDVAFVAYNANAINVPPTIGQNTATTNSVICTTGGNAYLEVTAYASSGGDLTYGWEVSTNGGTSWSAISDNATYSGSTTSGLTITGATAAYQYRATVTESITTYSATSPVFTITASAGSALAGTLNPTGFSNCLGAISGTTTLSVAPTGGTGSFSYQWSSSSTSNGVYSDIDGAVYITYTPSLELAGTTYYKVTVSSGCLSNTSAAAAVVVNGASVTAVTNGERCGTGFVTLGAEASAAATFNWYNAATGGSSLGTGSSFNTPNLSVSTTYYVSATASSCTTVTRTPVVATVKTTPTVTTTIPASNCGTGSVTLQAVASAGDINWYAASSGGSSLGSGVSFATPSINTTTTYYVDATFNGCTTASRSAVVATITPSPTLTSTTGASRCGTGTVVLNAATAAGTITWYNTSSGGTSLGSGTSFTTPSISTTTTYYADVTNAGCSAASRTAVNATVNSDIVPAVAISASSTSVCGATPITFTATPTNGGDTPSYQWKLNGSNVGTDSPTYTLASPANGNAISVVMTSNAAPCLSTPTATSNVITLTNATVTPAVSIASSAGSSICVATNVTFTAIPVNGGSSPAYQWFLNSFPVGTNSPTYSSSSLTQGDQITLTMTSNASCTSTSTANSNAITMTINLVPDITGTSPASRCGAGTVELGAAASGGTISWYTSASGGSAISTGTTYTTSSLSSTTTYYVEASSNGCTSSRTSVVATVNPIVSLSGETFVLTNATTTCAGYSSTVTASTTGLANGTYNILYDITGANASTDNTAVLTVVANTGTFSTAALASAGTSTIAVTDLEYGSCWTVISTPSTRNATITAAPNVSNFSATVAATCSNLQGSVEVVSSSMASANYVITYSISGSNTVNNATAQMLFTSGTPGVGYFTLPILSNAGANNVLTISSISVLNSSCASVVNYSTAAFENNLPVSLNAGSPITSCTGNVVVYLSGNAVQYGGSVSDYTSNGSASASNYSSLIWSTSNGTGSFQNNTTFGALSTATYTPSAADISAGSRLLTLTAAGNNGCSTVAQTISVTIFPSPQGGTLTGSSTVCAGTNSTTFDLTGNTGTLTRWESSPSSTFASSVTQIANTTTSQTATDLTSTTYYRSVSSQGVCLAYATGSVTVNPITVAGTISSAQDVCSNSAPENLVLSGNVGSVVRWEWATDVNFTTPNTVVSTSTTLLGSAIGNLTSSRYYRALVKSGLCNQEYTAPVLLNVISCAATVTKVRASQCGVLLAAISTNIYADAITNATMYRFEITGGPTVQYVNSVDRRFMLTEMATAPTYNTVYYIRVSVELNGTFGPYGATCSVTTPSPAGNTTQVQAAQCGVTLASMSTVIYANSIASATTYRFRITDGVNTTTIDSPDRMVTLTETGFEELGVTYTIDVSVEISSVFGDYGTACQITSPAPPSSEVQAVQCGATLPLLSTTIYANTYSGATTYRFRITDGVNSTIIDSPDRLLSLTELAFVAYGTAYTIDVAVEVNAEFYPYGNACVVSSPAAPTTNVQDSQCGVTVPAFTTLIYANSVEGATGYRFRVNDGDVEEIITSADRAFSLSELVFANYSTVYTIDVAVELLGTYQAYGSACNVTTIDPPYDPNTTTQVRSTQCGQQLPAINTNVYADAVLGATAYKFKITRAGVTDSIISVDRRIQLTELPNAAYNSTYTIQVAVQLGGNYGVYGPTCYVYTPSPYGILSQVQASQCGITVALFTTTIYATSVPGATMYRFRVSDGVTSSFIDSPDRLMNFAEFGISSYSTVYSVDVSVQKTGVFGPYGVACDITTPAPPTTQVQASQCGTTMTSTGSYIYADSYTGATAYRFRVSDGSNEVVISSPVRFFTLNETGFLAYSTTYTVEVALQMYGEYQAYGAACTVTTPAPPSTKVQDSQCGITLAFISTTLYANTVADATAYRFRVNDGTNTEVVESPDRLFNLTETTLAAYSGTYTIDVSPQVNGSFQPYGATCEVTTPTGATTAIQVSQCGTTLGYQTTAIYATSVMGASAYRFRVSNGVSTVVVESPDRKLYLSETGLSAPGTTYSIDVAVSYAGYYGQYGSVCTVTTPGTVPVATQVQASQCGITLALVGTSIYANSATGATMYRFRVTDGVTTNTVDSPDRIFNLPEAGFTAYDTEYTIDVAVQVGGSYTSYGTPCSVSTPVAPTTVIQASQCGQTLPFTTTGIKSNTVGGAQGYRFRVTDGVNTAIIDSPDRLIYLSETGFAANGTVYTIDVSVMLYNTYQIYGSPCTVTTPGVAGFAIQEDPNSLHATNFRAFESEVEEEFEADVYPNPTNGHFNVAVLGVTEGVVLLEVLDITGKAIEVITINSPSNDILQLGGSYGAGVYMMRFTQGDKMFTTRVVKN